MHKQTSSPRKAARVRVEPVASENWKTFSRLFEAKGGPHYCWCATYRVRNAPELTGAQKKAEYLAINPMGKVPALKDGEATLAEAAAICAYVAERHPDAKLAPPLGDARRAKYLYWLFFAPGCVEPAMVQIATKIEMNPVAAGWGEAQRVFDVLDVALAKGPWILGDDFSAADIAIGSALNFSVRLFKMVPSRPSFDAYIARCMARSPAW